MKRYECGCCGRSLTADKMVMSRFTKQRYCGVDFKRCEAGSRRRKKAALKLGVTQ